ncbi:tyrosine--tRNA ligase [Candidatus Woesebacteria bacterium]|nr:tyrosine--tRNA ligase [Candidatus Woesebacteria bacterium]
MIHIIELMDNSRILSRGVAKVLPSKGALVARMKKGKVKLYLGIDPSGFRLHLGHSVPIRKIAQFAEAGHEVVLLFGTGTVLVGDPSQRDTARKLIDQKEIDKNIKDWKEQVAPLIDFNKVTIKQNGDWLTKLTLREIIKIASNISAVQLFKREMFQRRIDKGDTVWYHETMYPLLQGYDSVAMDVDLEIGGTDQEFNMLIGRELQKKMNNREKYVLTVPMITGTDGKQMSKTSGNCVWLDDAPFDMFGKLMGTRDDQMALYMELLTDMPDAEIKAASKEGPMEAKKRLAWEIVKIYHGEKEADGARDEFEKVFQKGGTPQSAASHKVKAGKIDLAGILVDSGLAPSNSEARRLIEQGGVEWNGKKVTGTAIKVEKSGTLKVGKHRFLKVVT